MLRKFYYEAIDGAKVQYIIARLSRDLTAKKNAGSKDLQREPAPSADAARSHLGSLGHDRKLGRIRIERSAGDIGIETFDS